MAIPRNLSNLAPGADTSGVLGVSKGGTGLTTPGASGNVLVSDGTNWTSSAPATSGINVQTFSSSGTWTKPSGFSASSRVMIQAWGGGASGAVGETSLPTYGGGGGGGGYNFGWFSLSQFGATETVTIGAGGNSVSALNTSGNNGGTTSVGSLLSAFGGAGGGTNNGGGGGGQLSGGSSDAPGRPFVGASFLSSVLLRQGGGGLSSGGPQDAYIHGGGGGRGNSGVAGSAGQAGAASVWGAGGGGSSGGSAGSGGSSSFAGSGGAGATGASAASAGTAPGGGGGGTYTGVSGAGAAGRVIITVFPA